MFTVARQRLMRRQESKQQRQGSLEQVRVSHSYLLTDLLTDVVVDVMYSVMSC